MANRAVVVGIALVVGLGLYAGAVVVEDRLARPAGAAPTGDVVVSNASMHLDRVGRPTVVGEVLNGLAGPIDDATVTVRFLRDGTQIGSANGTTLVPIVDPNHAAPFAIRLENRTARPDEFSVSVEYETATGTPYRGLTVADTEVSYRSQTQVTVVGTVHNDGDRSVDTHVVATFYDANGTVVGVRSVRPSPAGLAPGANGEFSVRFRTLGDLPSRADAVTRYDVVVYGEPAE